MNILQRIVEALTPAPPQPPGGVVKMHQAIEALKPSTESLQQKVNGPLPDKRDRPSRSALANSLAGRRGES